MFKNYQAARIVGLIFQTARSRQLTPSPGWLRAVWKSGYEEVKASVHPTTQGNTSWWIWGDYPCFPLAIPGVGVTAFSLQTKQEFFKVGWIKCWWSEVPLPNKPKAKGTPHGEESKANRHGSTTKYVTHKHNQLGRMSWDFIPSIHLVATDIVVMGILLLNKKQTQQQNLAGAKKTKAFTDRASLSDGVWWEPQAADGHNYDFPHSIS